MLKRSPPKLAMIVALCVSLTAACNRSASTGHVRQADAPPAAPTTDTAAKPAEDDGDRAIKLVKQMVDQQGGLTVTLPLPYTQSVPQLVGCSPQEAEQEQSANPHNPELWRCKSLSGGPPFTKQVMTTTTQCCRTRTGTVKSSEIASWRSEDAGDGKWKVSADYAVLGSSHHATWIVDSKSSKIGSQSDS